MTRRLALAIALTAWSGCAPTGPAAVTTVVEPIVGEPARVLDDAPGLDWVESPSAPTTVMVEVHGLGQTATERLDKLKPSDEQWRAILRVVVDEDGARREAKTPLLGAYSAVQGTIRFRPRFPLVPGLRYSARFDPSALLDLTGESPPDGPTTPIESTFHLPASAPAEPAEVVAVHPKAEALPENLLKFYVHFSAPMSRGEAYRHLRLLDARGREVTAPFLELGEELWDPSGTRFTLLLDPGRIKRGLKPREEMGPILEDGKSYSLVIAREWPDTSGRPLRRSFRKPFQVGPPDDIAPETATWAIVEPKGETIEPLGLRFPEPLDHAMLGRVLSVEDGQRRQVTGRVEVDPAATAWRFVPNQPWSRGEYRVVVDSDLEDLAGNSIRRPFEVDVARPITDRVEAETVALPFRVR